MPGQDPNFTYRKPVESGAPACRSASAGMEWPACRSPRRDRRLALAGSHRTGSGRGRCVRRHQHGRFPGRPVARRRAQPFLVWLRKLGGGSGRAKGRSRQGAYRGRLHDHYHEAGSAQDRRRYRLRDLAAAGKRWRSDHSLPRELLRSARPSTETHAMVCSALGSALDRDGECRG